MKALIIFTSMIYAGFVIWFDVYIFSLAYTPLDYLAAFFICFLSGWFWLYLSVVTARICNR